MELQIHGDLLLSNHARATISWEDDTARYHVWIKVNRTGVESSGWGADAPPTIYKNPLDAKFNRHDERHFETRRLDGSAKAHQATMKAVLALANPLRIQAAVNAEREKQQLAQLRKHHQEGEEIRERIIAWATDREWFEFINVTKALSTDDLRSLAHQLRK